jgi:hypothetical protein
LLARRSEGALRVDIVAVHLLNGGLYPDLHRPEPIQTALLDPELGPQISAGITEEALTAALVPTFADGFDSASDSAAMWTTMSRDDGHRLLHLLIRYIVDRRDNENRWVKLWRRPTCRSTLSGACATRSQAPTWPSAFASVCLTLLSRPFMTLGTGHRSRHPSARSRLSGRTERRQLPSQSRARPDIDPRRPRGATRGLRLSGHAPECGSWVWLSSDSSTH